MIDYETEDRLEVISSRLKNLKNVESENDSNFISIWEEIALIKERLDKLESAK